MAALCLAGMPGGMVDAGGRLQTISLAQAAPAAASDAAAVPSPPNKLASPTGKSAEAASPQTATSPSASSKTAPVKAAAPKAEDPKTPSRKNSPTRGKAAPHANERHMGNALGAGSSWYLDGAPRKARGAVWERGIPMENLSRKRTAPDAEQTAASEASAQGAAEQTAARGNGAGRSGGQNGQGRPTGVDTTKGIDSALGEISSYERQPADGSALGLNKPGTPSLQVTKEESNWRSPANRQPVVGQDVMGTRRNVVGAYADVVKNEDLHVTVGPELHLPEAESNLGHLTPQQHDSSAVGFGMKWQWDF